MIIPGDMFDPGGSMGDIAMLSGLLTSLKNNDKLIDAGSFAIVGAQKGCIDIPNVGGVEVRAAWSGIWGFFNYLVCLMFARELYILGADVLDGRYSSHIVRKTIVFANIAALLKLKTVLVGFSFNNKPTPMSLRWLKKINHKIIINIRDCDSLLRFNKLIGLPAKLVADVAFLMPPSEDLFLSKSMEHWIDLQRKEGKLVVGVNINKHAFKDLISEHGVQIILDRFFDELKYVAKNKSVSFLLIPHDFKDSSGDLELLCQLKALLETVHGLAVTLSSIKNPASIKRMVGFLDLVITGRMHLAIAAFGVGVPPLSIDYQDKFSGLYAHFNFEDELLLQPHSLMREMELAEKIISCFDFQKKYVTSIKSILPCVHEIALKNLS